ncbi:MAG TPA: hypothetical protein VK427_07360 [Kofleriaceae bacterium]|nr:hypothetical protein [Kofleriaceae bacterium]
MTRWLVLALAVLLVAIAIAIASWPRLPARTLPQPMRLDQAVPHDGSVDAR